MKLPQQRSWLPALPLALAPLLAVLLGSLTGCPDPYVPDPPTGATCADVCAHWAELGCEEGKPTPDGATCVEVCENIQQGSLPDDLDCQVAVESCEQIDDC